MCLMAPCSAVLDPQDLLEDLKIIKLRVIRNFHAIPKSVKRTHCMVCLRETTSIDQPLSDIKLLEQGERYHLLMVKLKKFLKSLRC